MFAFISGKKGENINGFSNRNVQNQRRGSNN